MRSIGRSIRQRYTSRPPQLHGIDRIRSHRWLELIAGQASPVGSSAMDLAPPPRAQRQRFDRRDETVTAGSRPWGDGIYRRRIELRHDNERVIGELEDDFHHFAVALDHDGEIVTAIRAEGVRHPWDVCADADPPIQTVVGTKIVDIPVCSATRCPSQLHPL